MSTPETLPQQPVIANVTDETLGIWASGQFCDETSARLAAEVLRLRAVASAAFAAGEAAERETCQWSIDDYGGESMWETQCGHAFEFNDGGPKANGAGFCCYCGKRLVEAYSSEDPQR